MTLEEIKKLLLTPEVQVEYDKMQEEYDKIKAGMRRKKMDVLIKGLEMPTGVVDVKLIINSDGSVHRIIGWAVSEKMNATAIELPSHGKLCDKDAVWDMLHEICVKCNENKDNERHTSCIWCKIKDAYSAVYGSIPTILEVSR